MKQVLIMGETIEFRSFVKAFVESCSEFEVKGIAAGSKIALEKMVQSKFDVVIVDLSSSDLSAIELLREMKNNASSIPVLVFSTESWLFVENFISEIRYYSIGYVCRKLLIEDDQQKRISENKIASALEMKLNQLTNLTAPTKTNIEILVPAPKTKTNHEISEPAPKTKTNHEISEPPLNRISSVARWNLDLFKPQIIVIGSSTGGPDALEKIFSKIKLPLLCSVVIVQHMPKNFTRTLAEMIERVSGIPSKEAEHGEVMLPGRVYVAPGDFHLTISNIGPLNTFSLLSGQFINSVRPAVDPLFESASKVFGKNCMAYILTGMGEDGAIGASAVKNAGGAVVIQSQETCVVFGMPGAVKKLGAFDLVLNPEEIGALIHSQTKQLHLFV